VVEMVVGHHQVGDRTAGQFTNVIGDCGGFYQRRAGVDQQRSVPALDESDRDVQER